MAAMPAALGTGAVTPAARAAATTPAPASTLAAAGISPASRAVRITARIRIGAAGAAIGAATTTAPADRQGATSPVLGARSGAVAWLKKGRNAFGRPEKCHRRDPTNTLFGL